MATFGGLVEYVRMTNFEEMEFYFFKRENFGKWSLEIRNHFNEVIRSYEEITEEEVFSYFKEDYLTLTYVGE